MGLLNAEDKGAELDLEIGLSETEDNSKKESNPVAAKQEKSLFAKVSGGDVGTKEEKPNLYCNESNLSSISKHVSNKLFSGQESVDMEKTPVKEKRKKGSNKKAPKPPRPPRAPSLDAFDHKLIRELTELAMLKRARLERLNALKKMRTSKSSSSSGSSSILATIFTIVFCIVIIFQGMPSGRSSVSNFQGSPLSTSVDDGVISVQYPLNPSANSPNAPGIESHNFVKQVTSSDWSERTRRRSG
ncbi:uncharacterized protein LOC129298847 [Prosopis cineraria]|uniref:uncharacterized protein LOC129298847 n=1 Tax=Prosopis cineraria TaxID=364024 RepID=UPI00240EE532|nr:uncharacterized protein LOC129298847 [Prosopis cineraria]XP_054793263.1 uncharacterized protein LOC129298847 [Prosopis cineraria]XP_054793264.1 uncharacterized protein LOC129298847 [Prosopis cineraria]